MNKIGTYVKAILLPVIIGAVVGLIIAPVMDYETLQKPFLAPPGIVFPIVWTILYILMGISYGILKSNGLTNDKVNRIYYLQLIVNALWPIAFFVLKWRLFAFIWIILLAVLIIIMIKRFYEQNKLAGFLQIPYLAWTVFATYLNGAIYFLNK